MNKELNDLLNRYIAANKGNEHEDIITKLANDVKKLVEA